MAEPNAKKPAKKGDKLTLVDFEAARKTARTEGIAVGEQRAAERIGAIMKAFEPHLSRDGATELRDTCVDEGTSAARANELLLEFLGGDPEPVQRSGQQRNDGRSTDVIVGAEESEKWVEGATAALLVRSGLEQGKEARAEVRGNEFFAMTLGELARDYLKRNGGTSKMDRREIAGQAFVRAGMHGASDFANLLENIATKALLIGYEEAPETWAQWVRIGNLTDFKVASRVNLSSFSDFELVLENDEYTQGHMADLKETIQLSKYGKLFSISREAIINDDMDGFSRIPRAMGRAASRNVGDVVYAILTSNPTMNQDGVALFAAGHGNLAGSGAAISETSLDVGRNAMATQTSPAPGTGETGATLNISPAFLLVPSALLMTARKVVETPTAPEQGAGAGDLTVNTARNAYDVVWDTRLDADSTTAWYQAANPNLFDTIECAFLDGNQEPFLDSRDGWSIDGVEYKARHEVAAAPMDFRGLYKNPGA